MRGTEVGCISQLPLEIHCPGRRFTEVTPAAVQTGHSGTTLLGWDGTGWGQGLCKGRTQGVLERPRPTQALEIPQVEGDDWRLQAGEEVDLGDEEPPVACGSSLPSDQEASQWQRMKNGSG